MSYKTYIDYGYGISFDTIEEEFIKQFEDDKVATMICKSN